MIWNLNHCIGAGDQRLYISHCLQRKSGDCIELGTNFSDDNYDGTIATQSSCQGDSHDIPSERESSRIVPHYSITHDQPYD